LSSRNNITSSVVIVVRAVVNIAHTGMIPAPEKLKNHDYCHAP
jgi:hypothetical protein